jgi:prophage DNA circulation protein
MADEGKILNGFYKTIPIAMRSGSVAGGRKTVVKQFPSRDTQSVEDLGLQPRKYSLEIIVRDTVDAEYFSYRDTLLAVLEQKGPGELIHPMFGRIENILAVSYNISENFNSFGDTIVSVNFEVDNSTGIPQGTDNVGPQIATANNAVQAAVNSDIAENYSVTDSLVGNFQAAVDKVEGVIDAARESTAFIGEAAQTLNEFSAELGQLSADINSLVSDPLALGDAITGLFESVNGLYASASATFDTFLGFFGFGSADVEIKQDTVGRIERQTNNEILNGAVAASALGYAFLAATDIEFETVREIDELTAELDAQYELVLTGLAAGADPASQHTTGSSQDVIDSITDMRVKVLAALDDIRIDTSQIISVHTNPTTARLLGFTYYGNDTEGQALVDLNGFTDVSFIEGTVEVLTA